MISYLSSLLFGLAVSLGVVSASFLLWKKAKKKDLDIELIFDWSLVLTAAFLIFGRLTYILENFSLFAPDIFRWIHLVRYPGISGSGGFLGMIVVSFFFFRLKKTNLWPYLDALVVPLLYGFFFVQVGCLINGCTQGTLSKTPSFLSFLKVRDFFHPVIIYSLILTTIMISLFNRIGSDFVKPLKKFYLEEKLPFKADGLFFLFFLILFSLANLALAIFTVNTIYLNGVNSRVIYFSLTALISLILAVQKIGPKNLINLVRFVGRKKRTKNDKNP